jgi:hypothetical protein
MCIVPILWTPCVTIFGRVAPYTPGFPWEKIGNMYSKITSFHPLAAGATLMKITSSIYPITVIIFDIPQRCSMTIFISYDIHLEVSKDGGTLW